VGGGFWGVSRDHIDHTPIRRLHPVSFLLRVSPELITHHLDHAGQNFHDVLSWRNQPTQTPLAFSPLCWAVQKVVGESRRPQEAQVDGLCTSPPLPISRVMSRELLLRRLRVLKCIEYFSGTAAISVGLVSSLASNVALPLFFLPTHVAGVRLFRREPDPLSSLSLSDRGTVKGRAFDPFSHENLLREHLKRDSALPSSPFFFSFMLQEG